MPIGSKHYSPCSQPEYLGIGYYLYKKINGKYQADEREQHHYTDNHTHSLNGKFDVQSHIHRIGYCH